MASPVSSSVPIQARPRLSGWGCRRTMRFVGNGSVDTRICRSDLTTMTFVEPEKVRPDWAVPWACRTYSGVSRDTGATAFWTLDVPVRFSATARARRPSVSLARASDCAMRHEGDADEHDAHDGELHGEHPAGQGPPGPPQPGPPRRAHEAIVSSGPRESSERLSRMNKMEFELLTVTRAYAATRLAGTTPGPAVPTCQTKESPVRLSTQLKVTSVIVAAGLALSACGVSAEEGSSGGSIGSAAGPVKGLRILVPNSPGSGYDTTARARGQGHAGRRPREHDRGVQLRRRRWHRRPPAPRQREGQGRHPHADGARRRRCRLHEQVEGDAQRDRADRQAHRGVRGDRRPGRLAVHDARPARRRLEGRPGQGARRWRLQPRWPRPPDADAAGEGRRRHAEGRQLRRVRRRWRAADRHPRQEGRLRRDRYQRGRRAGQER